VADISIDINPLLQPLARFPGIRRVVLERELLPRAADCLRPILPPGPWLLVADAATWSAAGAGIGASLERQGIALQRYLAAPGPNAANLTADDAAVQTLEHHLHHGKNAIRAVVAVGAGTINDIAKLATFRVGIPYAVVATAPSMNGYTSGVAAILSKGVKTTVPCHQPQACLGDLDVLARAPHRMIAAGLGDLLSRPVSIADWYLSHQLQGSDYSPEVLTMVEKGAEFLQGVAPKLPRRDVEAVGRLAAALCISGLAMGLAGSSAPASGGEHLLSHYLDMTQTAAGAAPDLHGCQVGVATLATAALYQQLLPLNPASIDIDARLRAHIPWPTYATLLKRRFGPLAAALLPQAEAAYPSTAELRRRLLQLKEKWRTLVAGLHSIVQPAAAIKADLEAGEAPLSFAQIGVAPERALRALRYSKDIRARYTILHLCDELGVLPQWSKIIVAKFAR